MKRALFFVPAFFLSLLFFPFSAFAEDRPVLTIGEITTRNNSFDKDLGFVQYLEEKLGADIEYVFMTPEAYNAALSNNDLPDIVSTNNNLSTILFSVQNMQSLPLR